jgi:hypothetical protein
MHDGPHRGSFVVAYVRNRVSGSWRYGCSDAACLSQRWQLQAFSRQAGSEGISGTWRGNVAQPGAPRYTVVFQTDSTSRKRLVAPSTIRSWLAAANCATTSMSSTSFFATDKAAATQILE